jgi:CopA family copper-resistance protein
MTRGASIARTALTRRRFVLGAAAGGALATAWPGRNAFAVPQAPVLSGTDFQLEIGPLPVNFTGRPRIATAINAQIPGPILRWREGDTVTLAVTNRLDDAATIHWHGVRTPSPMDGVPGLSQRDINSGGTFVYRFPVRQNGTYWYHAHSPAEQTGVYAAIAIEPKGGYTQAFDRDYTVVLSDWSDERPGTIISNLKFYSGYYNFNQRTADTFFADAARNGLSETISDRIMWGKMRMSPTDILDVTGATYTYLLNGQPPAANWTALFRPGERVRLRFIAAGTMTIFDVRIPDLPMTVVQSDGNDLQPVTVDQFRFGPGETYDVIVQPREARAYTIFAQAQDRSGFARGTLAPRAGMTAAIPLMDPRPMRTMVDMGMGGMDQGSMPGMTMNQGSGMPPNRGSMPGTDRGSMSGMPANHGSMAGMQMGNSGMAHGAAPATTEMAASAPAPLLQRGVEVDNVAETPTERLNSPGEGFPPGRRVLTYAEMRATRPGGDPRPPSREITLHLTGNMERFIWGFDGKKFSEAEPIILQRGERVRFVLINDTMMEHPMHLHGLWSELENGHGAYRPYKHTLLVKPGERLSFLVNADEPGRWAFHCHLLYHMEVGMFREVRVV